MAIISYSKRTVGNMDVSKNFKVREFASKDGADTVKIDDLTLSYLQAARDHFNVPFIITSGYRSPTHNRAVGGATNSYHVKGQAVDHHTDGKIDLFEMAKFYESIGCKGIIVYPNSGFVHVDSRPSKYFAIDRNGKIEAKITFGALTAKNITGTCTGNGVRLRAKANLLGKILTKLYKNETFEILGTSGSWTQIKYRSITGYVSSRYVKRNE